jgi:lipoprotein-anchoring transpeptidase ErfK/SrfK
VTGSVQSGSRARRTTEVFPTGVGESEAPANWIEQPASHGCVRMLQADIDRLFHLAIEGTSVTIGP